MNIIKQYHYDYKKQSNSVLCIKSIKIYTSIFIPQNFQYILPFFINIYESNQRV